MQNNGKLMVLPPVWLRGMMLIYMCIPFGLFCWLVFTRIYSDLGVSYLDLGCFHTFSLALFHVLQNDYEGENCSK